MVRLGLGDSERGRLAGCVFYTAHDHRRSLCRFLFRSQPVGRLCGAGALLAWVEHLAHVCDRLGTALSVRSLWKKAAI